MLRETMWNRPQDDPIIGCWAWIVYLPTFMGTSGSVHWVQAKLSFWVTPMHSSFSADEGPSKEKREASLELGTVNMLDLPTVAGGLRWAQRTGCGTSTVFVCYVVCLLPWRIVLCWLGKSSRAPTFSFKSPMCLSLSLLFLHIFLKNNYLLYISH